MRVVATTVVRESKVGRQLGGRIFELDWESGEVVATLPVPDPSNPSSDDNPRGGVRGGRGAALFDGEIVIANYDSLLFYDRAWRLRRRIEHPLLLGLHEIDTDDVSIFVSATAIDAALRVTPTGEIDVAFDPHEAGLRGQFGLSSRSAPLNPSTDRMPALIDECHLNGVKLLEGQLVLNLGMLRMPRVGIGERHGARRARRMIVRTRTDGDPEILLEQENPDALPIHNGQLLAEGRLAFNDSARNVFKVITDTEDDPIVEVGVEGTWLRGMYPVDDQHVLLGTAPATVSLVSIPTARVVRSVRLSSNPHEAVHGLIALD